MAVRHLRQSAPVVLQREETTVSGNWAAGEKASLTVDGATLEVTATQTMTFDQIGAAMASAINGSGVTGLNERRNTDGSLSGLIGQLDASYVSPVLIITGKTQRPFVASVSDTAVAGALTALTTIDSPSGPEHVIAENFSGGILPVNGDEIIIDDMPYPLKWQLNKLPGVDPLKFHARASAANMIGLPVLNTEFSAAFNETQPTYLQLSHCNDVKIGEGTGRGQSLIKLQFMSATNSSKITVLATDTPAIEDRLACQIRGTFTGTQIDMIAGSLELCPEEGDTAIIDSVECSGGRLKLNRGVTISSPSGRVDLSNDAYLDLLTSCPSLQFLTAGVQCDHYEGTIGTLNAQAGGILRQMGGTSYTAVRLGNASFDATLATQAYTITTLFLVAKGFRYWDKNAKGTITNPISTGDIALEDGEFEVGLGRAITIA